MIEINTGYYDELAEKLEQSENEDVKKLADGMHAPVCKFVSRKSVLISSQETSRQTPRISPECKQLCDCTMANLSCPCSAFSRITNDSARLCDWVSQGVLTFFCYPFSRHGRGGSEKPANTSFPQKRQALPDRRLTFNPAMPGPPCPGGSIAEMIGIPFTRDCKMALMTPSHWPRIAFNRCNFGVHSGTGEHPADSTT